MKSHPFFAGIDWHQVYTQKYTPPLMPPRGEVNAADAFDIGSFDEEDTKGIKLTEQDQEMYQKFPLTISERYADESGEGAKVEKKFFSRKLFRMIFSRF